MIDPARKPACDLVPGDYIQFMAGMWMRITEAKPLTVDPAVAWTKNKTDVKFADGTSLQFHNDTLIEFFRPAGE